MKIAILVVLLVAFFLGCILMMLYRAIDKSVDGGNSKQVDYAIRYNPGNNKYYVVSIKNARETSFKHYGFFTKYYQYNTQAEVVVQKLKGNF